MKYAYALTAMLCGFFVGCSEQKSEPLPDLPPVEIPADVYGFYSGRESLLDLQEAAVPGAQVLTGMPHTPGVKDKVGNLAYMKQGDVFRDADGMKAVMVRFYKKIKK